MNSHLDRLLIDTMGPENEDTKLNFYRKLL